MHCSAASGRGDDGGDNGDDRKENLDANGKLQHIRFRTNRKARRRATEKNLRKIRELITVLAYENKILRRQRDYLRKRIEEAKRNVQDRSSEETDD